MGARTWSKFRARGEHGDVFPVLQLRCARILRELFRYSLHICWRECKGQSFFPSDTLIYGISRDCSKNFNIRTCEHMILGQLRIWARPATYAALLTTAQSSQPLVFLLKISPGNELEFSTVLLVLFEMPSFQQQKENQPTRAAPSRNSFSKKGSSLVDG